MPSLIGTAVLFLPLLTLQTHASQLAAAVAPSCSNVPVQPPPAGLVCGEKGKIKNPSILSTMNLPNAQSCANSCLSTSATSCVGFSYGPSKKCTLYDKPFAGAGQGYQADPTSQMIFWNRRCYQESCTCPLASQKICAGSCVDTSTDSKNCGACNKPVSQGQTCCSGVPVNTLTDPKNCGACNKPVTQGQTCCSGTAVNTLTDPKNCGACSKPVSQGETCCSGASVNTMTDPSNCGSCGTAVAGGHKCCSGRDVDIMTSAANCGGCGQTIPQSQTCCAGTGVDILTDNKNCGACGKQCTGSQVCTAGSCKTPCTPGPGPQLLQNPGFDDSYSDETTDPPWTITNATFVEDVTSTSPQAGSVFVHFAFSSGGVSPFSGSVYQDVQSLVAGHSYTISTYYQPIAIYPSESGGDIRYCTMTVSLANQPIITKQISHADSPSDWLQITNSNVLYNGPSSTARLEIAFSCPKYYIGRGLAHMYFDTVSITENLSCPV